MEQMLHDAAYRFCKSCFFLAVVEMSAKTGRHKNLLLVLANSNGKSASLAANMLAICFWQVNTHTHTYSLNHTAQKSKTVLAANNNIDFEWTQNIKVELIKWQLANFSFVTHFF